jgi:hypothetical protein
MPLLVNGRWPVIGELRDAETFASGRGIRDLPRLLKLHGGKNWRKCKGFGHVRLDSGEVVACEIHWYEAHGVGKVELKAKEWL